MDRSYLSHAEVIAASRAFVCVCLTTYENEQEAALLKSLMATRSGDVENTVFTILAPDGKRQLVRARRSTRELFADAAQMAAAMNHIARDYPAPPAAGPSPELPKVANFRLAVNVAACDNRPLVVLAASGVPSRRRLEEQLTALAWSEQFLGQFTYVAVEPKELGAIEGAKTAAGVLVVQPDRFGRKGKVLKQVGADVSRDELARCLQEGADRFRPEVKAFGAHVRDGRNQDVFWQTVIPVTDPMEQRARERGRNPNRPPE